MPKPRAFHRLGAVEVAAVVREASSVTAAAKRLGVNRSSLTRWISTGRVEHPRGPVKRRQVAPGAIIPAAGSEPAAGWRESIERDYVLTATEREIVDLAATALDVARDPGQRTSDRLAAMGRYQRLVAQLNLEQDDEHGETTFPHRPGGTWPQRVL